MKSRPWTPRLRANAIYQTSAGRPPYTRGVKKKPARRLVLIAVSGGALTKKSIMASASLGFDVATRGLDGAAAIGLLWCHPGNGGSIPAIYGLTPAGARRAAEVSGE